MPKRKIPKLKQPQIRSDFAILDVKAGRHDLKSMVEAGLKFPVVIYGTIDTVHSHDDGVSVEFSLDVHKVTLGHASPRNLRRFSRSSIAMLREKLIELDPPPFLRKAVEREIAKLEANA